MELPLLPGSQKTSQQDPELGITHPHGHVLFREGDESDGIYFVTAGSVRVITTTPTGREVELASVGPGEIFGITTLFDNLPRSATAVVDGGASVLKIDKKKLIKAVHHDPSLVINILRSIAKRVRILKQDLVAAKEGQRAGE